MVERFDYNCNKYMCRLCCVVDSDYSKIKRTDEDILDCYSRCDI